MYKTILVAGYDHQSQGGQVWTVPVGGMCVRQPVSIGGSGSSFLYGMMDHMFKVIEDNTEEEIDDIHHVSGEDEAGGL